MKWILRYLFPLLLISVTLFLITDTIATSPDNHLLSDHEQVYLDKQVSYFVSIDSSFRTTLDIKVFQVKSNQLIVSLEYASDRFEITNVSVHLIDFYGYEISEDLEVPPEGKTLIMGNPAPNRDVNGRVDVSYIQGEYNLSFFAPYEYQIVSNSDLLLFFTRVIGLAAIGAVFFIAGRRGLGIRNITSSQHAEDLPASGRGEEINAEMLQIYRKRILNSLVVTALLLLLFLFSSYPGTAFKGLVLIYAYLLSWYWGRVSYFLQTDIFDQISFSALLFLLSSTMIITASPLIEKLGNNSIDFEIGLVWRLAIMLLFAAAYFLVFYLKVRDRRQVHEISLFDDKIPFALVVILYMVGLTTFNSIILNIPF